jgi:hypothetical protein
VSARAVARFAIGALIACACTHEPTTPADAPAVAAPSSQSVQAPAGSASAQPAHVSPRTDADDPALRAILEEMSKIRGLPVREPVRVTTLDRETLLAKVRKKVAEELPPDVLELQGETLRALGLVPSEYDVVEGLFKLVQGRVAGFYDPDDKTMYLLDDLEDAQRDETLPHELVHALQDQSFSIGPLLDYKAGESDRSTAIQLLVEGDAMSAGFDYSYETAVVVEPKRLKEAFQLSTALSRVGMDTPPVLIGSLIAPYTDGFGFVQALRQHGGWRQVNLAFKDLPESTEQALHPEKYFVRERPLTVAAPPVSALGEGFEPALVDTNGELGLRLVLEQWTGEAVASKGAAGWGGDKYIMARKRTDAASIYALAMVTRMDTAADAKELATIIEGKFGACAERSDLGPIAVKLRHRDVVVVAGPYERGKSSVRAAGNCEGARAWIKSIVAATPK